MIYPYSAIFYTIILVFTTFLATLDNLLNTKLKKLNLLSIILILSLCSGFRAESVGRDTRAYMMIIGSCRVNYFGVVDNYVERGFVLFVKSILFIYDNPQFVLFVISLIINSMIIGRIYSLKNKISFPFAVFSYVSLYYLATYSGIRQWIAIAMVFFGSKYLFKGKYIIFTIFVLMASAIHNSALVALLYIPLDMLFLDKTQVKHKTIFYASIIFSPFIVYGFYMFLIKTGLIYKYNHLLSDEYKSYNIGFSIFIKIAIILFVSTFVKETDYRFNDKVFCKKVILIYLIGVLISFIGYFYKNIFRISWYFIIYEIIFFSMVSKTKRFGILLKYIIILILIYLFYRGLSGADVSQMPYVPFWKN